MAVTLRSIQPTLATALLLLGRSSFAVRSAVALAFAIVAPPAISVTGRDPTSLLRRRPRASPIFAMAARHPSSILESPSAERNKGPISDVLASHVYPRLLADDVADDAGRRDAPLARRVRVLELAAGCGVHSTHFAASFPSAHADRGVTLEWHPSDPDAEARASIDARVRRARLEGSVAAANGWVLGVAGGTACGDGDRGAMRRGDRAGEVADCARYGGYFDLVTCINMIHIAPWEATLGLMECAGKVLRKGGRLMCYGPYKIGGTTVESNL